MTNTTVTVFNNPDFGDIRTVMIDGEPWFVAADVCRALDLDDTSKAVSRLKENEKGKKNFTTPGGAQEMLIVNEPGLYRLIFTSRKPEAEKFQYWVYNEVLPSIRKTGGYGIKQVKVSEVLEDISKSKKYMEEIFGVKDGIAIAKSIFLVQQTTTLDLSQLNSLIPAASHSVGRYNATDIAEMADLKNARAANLKLLELGLQYRDGGSWYLTDEGKKYGEAVPYTNNGHSGYQILWSPEVLELIDDEE